MLHRLQVTAGNWQGEKEGDEGVEGNEEKEKEEETGKEVRKH